MFSLLRSQGKEAESSLFFSYCFVIVFLQVTAAQYEGTNLFGQSFIYGGNLYINSTHQSIKDGILDKKHIIEAVVEVPSGYCGGTIIGDRFILTAAHCFVPDNPCQQLDENVPGNNIVSPKDVHVFIEGICYSASEEQNCKEEDRGRKVLPKTIYILKEYYEKKCTSGDLAIIELAETIGDHGATISDNKILPISGDLILSGFGADPTDSENDLHMLKTVTLTAKKCAEQTFYDSICTVEINKDACQGDSGGALIDEKNVIYGVVSSGTGCSEMFTSVQNHESDEQPLKEWAGGVFTSVSSHVGFICEIVSSLKICSKSINKELYVTLS